MNVCTSPCRSSSSLIWVQVPPDSAEYARYEAAERAAHESARAARSGPPRAPSGALGRDHVRDMALIAAQRPTVAGSGLYLFPVEAPAPPTPLGVEPLPVFKGWLSETDALAWLCAYYPRACETAAACMATCAGDHSLCACGVIDPPGGAVRFYAVPALPRRRHRRHTRRHPRGAQRQCRGC